ncbi:MAG: peptidase T [Salinispira sp.]
MQDVNRDRAWFENNILERFLRYVQVHTTSDPHSTAAPSTEGQWNLARLLEQELQNMGVPHVELTEHCNILARLPANAETACAPVMFLAHMDTAPDFNGNNVRPQVHEKYNGDIIRLGKNIILDPDENPALKNHIDDTVITADGSSLLGADDKAGIAEIMTAVQYLLEHPDIRRGEVEIIFTPDEEIARGTLHFPGDRVHARCGFTLDGEAEGSYNARCFNAYEAELTFTGLMIHPGRARGCFVNALSMAAQYVGMLPRSESPESTDAGFGYYAAREIGGSMEQCRLAILVRDFENSGMERRLEYLRQLARITELSFPGGKVDIVLNQQYRNLMNFLEESPELISILEDAIRATGIEPFQESIRGGTDGARLSEMGFPTPNIFTGGHNFHGPREWIGLRSMVRASKVMLNIIEQWAG